MYAPFHHFLFVQKAECLKKNQLTTERLILAYDLGFSQGLIGPFVCRAIEGRPPSTRNAQWNKAAQLMPSGGKERGGEGERKEEENEPGIKCITQGPALREHFFQ